MISKNWVKFVRALQQKKYRKEEQAFFAEGGKTVLELLESRYVCQILFATNQFFDENKFFLEKIRAKIKFPIEIATESELLQIGTMQTNNACLAVFGMPKEPSLQDFLSKNDWVLALDNLQDPGNLGTILRICDWYGIKKVFCSSQTVDCYNPKTVNATMGSLARTDILYGSLSEYLKLAQKANLAILGTFMNGESVHHIPFKILPAGVLVMGNEANGISNEIEQFCSQKITIPRFGQAESLNVGIATAIILDNLKRNG